MFRSLLRATTIAVLVTACGAPLASEPSDTAEMTAGSSALLGGRIPDCVGLPRVDRTRDGYVIGSDRGWIVPAHPAVQEEIFVAYRLARAYQSRAHVRFTTDGWRTSRDLDLREWCSDPADPFVLVGYSIGSFPQGTHVELAIAVEPLDASQPTEWLNNERANYALDVGAHPGIEWVGDAHLRINGETITAASAPAGQPLQVYAQTFPAGPMHMSLFVSDSNGTTEVPMALERDGAGSNGNNSQWRGTIPAERMRAGQRLQYWIRATDLNGKEAWDSNNGANYRVTPRAYPVMWAGGFGQYRPTDRSYREGSLFLADGSTSFGCFNHGASASSYVVRAVRVYVPGITDRADVPPGASSILRAELYTDLREGGRGWHAVPATFARKLNNDFIYTFMSYGELCGGGVEAAGSRIADGSYGFKMRFSTDNGATWFWRGTDNGPNGGNDLGISFRARCGYFGDPLDCLP